MSFTALRDSAPFPQGQSARRFFAERMNELAKYAARLDAGDMRVARAAGLLKALAARAQRFNEMATTAPDTATATLAPVAHAAPPTVLVDGAEIVDGETVQITFNGKLCIHSRFCVTGAPKVFLANVKGPWIHPDAMDAEELMAVARECPSGAIQYRLAAATAGARSWRRRSISSPCARRGPMAFAAISASTASLSAIVRRCAGAAHRRTSPSATAHTTRSLSPPRANRRRATRPTCSPRATGRSKSRHSSTARLVRGNLEIISGTGRVVARQQAARLCRCGHSNTKPFCDGTHAKIGFRSE